MIWSSKFDLFHSQGFSVEPAHSLIFDTSTAIGSVPLEGVGFDWEVGDFEPVPAYSGGAISAFGTGSASVSFAGSASGAGSSSVSGSASAYVAPDGSSGAFLDVSAIGEAVSGAGSVSAGTDVDAFEFGQSTGAPDLYAWTAPSVPDLTVPDVPEYEIDIDVEALMLTEPLDLSIWL